MSQRAREGRNCPRFPAVCSGERMHYSPALLSRPEPPGTPRAPSLLFCPTFPPPAACLQCPSRDEIMEQRDSRRISSPLYNGKLSCWEKEALGGPMRLKPEPSGTATLMGHSLLLGCLQHRGPSLSPSIWLTTRLGSHRSPF